MRASHESIIIAFWESKTSLKNSLKIGCCDKTPKESAGCGNRDIK